MSVLIVLTNCDEIVKIGHKTGWYLPEVAHPCKVFADAKLNVDFVSPKGGKAPMDPGSQEQFKNDPICQAFEKNDEMMKKIANTMRVKDVDPSKYKCIFYAGGHGPMFDLPNNDELAKLCSTIYEDGKVVAAVCHGTVGLLNVKLKNGDFMIKGQKVTSFTNDEENAVKLMEVMPFALETKLKENGATFKDGGVFKSNVVVSGRIVTGQNPASATETANAIVKIIK